MGSQFWNYGTWNSTNLNYSLDFGVLNYLGLFSKWNWYIKNPQLFQSRIQSIAHEEVAEAFNYVYLILQCTIWLQSNTAKKKQSDQMHASRPFWYFFYYFLADVQERMCSSGMHCIKRAWYKSTYFNIFWSVLSVCMHTLGTCQVRKIEINQSYDKLHTFQF